ncbi:MAG: porin [Wolbachia endosymbiont of Fragariocoptes setiger]|nr:porin [Wolbachia endosymbiont of Fragariocoptes setiger]
MKLRYCITTLLTLFFLHHNAYTKTLLNKKPFYIELSGQIDLKFGHALNQDSFQNKPHKKISNYSNVRLLYLQNTYLDTQTGFGVKIGGSNIINLNSIDIKKINFEEKYFIIKNKSLGTLECGKKDLISQSMLINTSKIYTASGGVNGDWANYANLRGGENEENNDQKYVPKKYNGAGYDKDKVFWVKPDIYSKYNGLNNNDAKLYKPVITYILPEIYNFQFGFSYVPGQNDLYYNNLIGIGLSYKNRISDDISFTTSFTTEFARKNFTEQCISDYNCKNQLWHWNYGINLQFLNLVGIFSYGNGGKSGTVYTNETKNTYYVNAGIAYNSDARKISLTYFSSKREIDRNGTKELLSYAISIEYPLFIGTSYYFDLVKFNTKEQEIYKNNSGYVVLAGLKLNF